MAISYICKACGFVVSATTQIHALDYLMLHKHAVHQA